MARRPNYGFEKRQKEMDRQKKKDAKAERKELRKKEAEGETGQDEGLDTGAEGANGEETRSSTNDGA